MRAADLGSKGLEVGLRLDDKSFEESRQRRDTREAPPRRRADWVFDKKVERASREMKRGFMARVISQNQGCAMNSRFTVALGF